MGRKTLTGVERADIDRFVAALSTKLSASTVHDRMTLVRSLFQTAVDERRIPRSPVDGAKLPRVGIGAVDEDAIPTREEVDLIARHIGPCYRLSVYLQAGTGLRVSEALAFATRCRRAGVLRVREQVSRTAHRADCPDRFRPLKHRTPGAYRDVPLPAFLEREIDAHLRRWGVTSVGGRDVLFVRRGAAAGAMPTATTYGPDFRRAVRAAGLLGRDRTPRYTPHTLRHFFASTALANEVPLHEVSRWLGTRRSRRRSTFTGTCCPPRGSVGGRPWSRRWARRRPTRPRRRGRPPDRPGCWIVAGSGRPNPSSRRS
ncbi:tyrosine-type recombinase/integrase [Streptomyces sioyaensis]|uniref:tyrosine-type recombinase/integrase n=1 Tax=Streptomyces sioyaensis TaxID=67364 RepID=UPI00379BE027